MKSFTTVFDAVEQNFADKVDADKAVYNGAIPGMLRTLDPHSNFFDPKAYAALREDQRGQYYGVGMQVGPRNGKTMVMWPFETSPAYRAGLRPGDMIIQVNDKKTEGLNTSEIAELLKGPRGTKVQVTVNREGNRQADHLRYHSRRHRAAERSGSHLAEARHRLHQRHPVRRKYQQGI